jgi:glycerate kinase
MLPAGRFHPFELDTWGLGEVIRAASEHGARRCVIGIGGSATNDAGFGMARALGWKFFDDRQSEIRQWTSLARLQRISPPRRRKWFADLRVAVDVQNRLLGPRGATRIYGPQKGIRPRDFRRAERALGQLALVMRRFWGQDFAAIPGAGAAGGLGFGLMAFAGGRLVPGFELFEREAALRHRLKTAELVLTGEGALDNSTLMGKGVGEIAWRCRQLRIPCFGFAGRIEGSARLNRLFDQTYSLTDVAGLADAQARPACWLTRLAKQLALSIEADAAAR